MQIHGVTLLLYICLFPGAPTKSGLRGFYYISEELKSQRQRRMNRRTVGEKTPFVDKIRPTIELLTDFKVLFFLSF